MKQVAMFDRGDHWEIVADYSLSPRHGALSEAQWKAEFAGPAYEAMRTSQPGLVAAHAPKGLGKWKKDWSAPHVVPSFRIQLSSDAAPDFDGVPALPSTGKHTVIVRKVGDDLKEAQGSEALRFMITAPVPVSPPTLVLQRGQAILSIGPSGTPCDVTLTVADPAGVIRKASIALRFR